MAAEDVEDAVQVAHIAFKKYRTITPRQRAELLSNWYQLITDNKDDIAKIIILETVKPLAEASPCCQLFEVVFGRSRTYTRDYLSTGYRRKTYIYR